MSKNTRTRILLTAVAALLLVVMTVGGTLAWLQDVTDEVTNTFTTANVDIELAETTTTYEMVPGQAISKDPKVTVIKGSEKCWVFVEITETFPDEVKIGEKEYTFMNFLPYTVDSHWKVLDATNYPNIYYTLVEEATSNVELPVLTGNSITVPNTVTNEMMDKVEKDADGNARIALTFKAYAIQYVGFEIASGEAEATAAADAWVEAQKLTTAYKTPADSTEGTTK